MSDGWTRPLWKRDEFRKESPEARVILLCLSEEPLEQPDFLRRAARDDLAITAIPEEYREELLRLARGIGAAMLRRVPEMAARWERLTQVSGVIGHPVDPKDLRYLQRAWQAARFYADCGAALILDAVSARTFSGDELRRLADPIDFAIEREISILTINEDDYEGRVLLLTVGLAKFARPDLVVRSVEMEHVDQMRGLLLGLAHHLAQGARVTPAGALYLPEDCLQLYEVLPGYLPELHPDNDVWEIDLELSFDDGEDDDYYDDEDDDDDD